MRVLVLNDRVAIVAGRDGYFLINRKDAYVGKALEIYGEYNAAEAAFLKRLLEPGDHVVEVGANIGSHTVGLAKAVGPSGMVYAFEAQRACFSILQAQIALNQLSNILAYPEAVGRAAARLWVPQTDYGTFGNFGGVSLSGSPAPGSEPVEVVALDARLADVHCALLKIDVEGMEEDVIHGAKTLIEQHHPILYVENDRPEKSKSLITAIRQFGYRLWWHIPLLYSPDNFFGIKENIYPKIGSFNMACSHEWHEAFSGLVEIKSPDDPHPAAPRPMQASWGYTIGQPPR